MPMIPFLRYPSLQPRYVLLAALGVCIGACGGGDGGGGGTARIAVLSAFPAEMAPIQAQASVQETAIVNGHTFRIGTLAGVPVVFGLTGIGLVNAAETTRAVLDTFDVAGVVVSAVAGSTLRVGDVTVARTWTLPDDTTYPASAGWLQAAEEVASSGTVVLQRCTVIPNNPAKGIVCLPHQPDIVVGGVGQSEDPFNDMPLPCQPGGDDVFGCDVPLPAAAATAAAETRDAARTTAASTNETTVVMDMETAAIARETVARGLPFIAFRATSDGSGDPLGLPGFPAQFFAYYRLSAHNAAAATVAFLRRAVSVATTAMSD